MCQVSCVRFRVLGVFFFLGGGGGMDNLVGLVGGGSAINGACPV